MTEKTNTKAVDICIKTWKNDSNGIFYYKSESSQILEVNNKITKNIYFIRRRNNNIKTINQNSDYDDEDEILFHIRNSFKTHQFEIVNPVRKLLKKNEYNINGLNGRMWYIVKTKNNNHNNNNNYEIDNEDYELSENDIIKLGRRKFEIVKKNINSNKGNYHIDQENYNISEMNRKRGSIFDINLAPEHYKITENEKEIKETSDKNILKTNDVTAENSDLNNKDVDSKINSLDNYEEDFINNENEELCRTCFDGKSSKENPKICLCLCKDYIHYECLKK